MEKRWQVAAAELLCALAGDGDDTNYGGNPGLMGPLQAMDRSIAAAQPLDPPAEARFAAQWLRLAALALVLLLALAALLAPLLRGSRDGTQEVTLLQHASLANVPSTARAEVSAVLGTAQPAFRVRSSGGALRARNAANALHASFAGSGVRLRSRGVDVSLSLRALGIGDSLQAVARALPTAHANRVSYARGGALTEWYANGPAGLEQGFTLMHAPGHATQTQTQEQGPLTLSLALGGSAHASLAPGARSLTLRSGMHTLKYGGLEATDANGHALRSWLALEGGRLLIRVDAAHARYPLTIDPLIEASGKLTGAGEIGEGQFGSSVALSADGDTLLVGAPHDANVDRGAAWFFTRAGSTWVQQGSELTGAEGAPPGEEEQCAEEAPEEAGECAFGASVALSADGNTALIGEPSATARPGSAWVFKRTGSGAEAKWTRAIILPGEGGAVGGRFGKSVALSADGATALVGDPSADGQRGDAWVFALSGASATVQGELVDAEAAHFDHVGRSVALSGDGDTALIGVPGAAEYTGAALVFTRAGESWSRVPGELTGEAETGAARFGKSVALSGDGGTALIGGQNDNETIGAAWGFVRSGESFVAQGGKLVGPQEAGVHFGMSVALSGDGSFALIGAPRAGDGEAFQYTHSSSGWAPVKGQLAGVGESGKGWQSASVALSSEADVAVLGAPHDNAREGAAWVFGEAPIVTPAPPAVTQVLPGFGPAGTAVRIKGSGFTSATAVSFGSVPAASFEFTSEGVIKAVAPAGEGIVDVTVQTPAGVSAINTRGDSVPGDDMFRFTASGAGGGPGGPDKKGGGTTPAPPEVTTTTTTTVGGTGSKPPSGGVLGTTSSSAAACEVTLRSKRLAVTSYRTVALRLLRTGAGACSGKLTLNFNLRPKGKRPKLKAIGTASYSISSGASKVFKITLNKAGRKLFRAHRGKLNVSLAIVRAVPVPRLAKSASVRLTWKKTHKALTLTR
ncbi:MAG TPA: IPT/TIG domain-containing protein [Solirubrobacteraceae bacterium]|nr:IPT/TIG domain-containing protein [Solirubrobacteraceae bacterium]